jgi:uncharacterized repeat protein (TIGR01451 family)
LTLDVLVDDVFGDLLDPANPGVSANTCPAQPPAIPPAGALTCSFEADLVGNGGGPVHTDVVTATVSDDEANTASDTDAAVVSFTDSVPTLTVAKTPSPLSVPEPGGTVTFTVEIENTSPEIVTLTGLADDVFGDLLDAGNPAVSANTCPAAASASIPPSGVLTCSFDGTVSGDASGPDHTDTVTATVTDDESNVVSDQASAGVSFTDVVPAITVSKSPSPVFVPEPGGTVTFTVEVTNTTAEDVTISDLSDDVFGDLLEPTNPLVAFNDCPAQALIIGGGAALVCSFDADIIGNALDPAHADTVTATASDDDGNSVSESDTALVPIGDVLPAVTVVKTPSPASVAEPGGLVTFSIDVGNPTTEVLTLDVLVDDVFGDLLDAGNPAVSANTCPSQPSAIAPGGSLTCSFDGAVSGDASGPDHTDTVTATVRDDEGNEESGAGEATVGFTDSLPLIAVSKSPSSESIPEPGGPVTFTIVVDNLSGEPVTVLSLVDDVFGDLLDPANPAVFESTCPTVAVEVPAGGALTCTFSAEVIGTSVDPDHLDTVTASAEDDEGTVVTADDSATVSFSSVDTEISGHLFVDTDGDGTQDPGEPGLAGVDVMLIHGGSTTTVTSDSGGDWTAAVTPGNVTMSVLSYTVPAGYVLTTANSLQSIVVDPGVPAVTEDVGYREDDGAVRGTVFLDLDGDDTADESDPPLEGIRVLARDDAGAVAGEAVTGEDGGYLVEGLRPGEYSIELDPATIPAGLEASWDADQVPDRITLAVVTAGDTVSDLDFAERGTGVIGDLVWIDTDGDGEFDTGETPLQGVAVALVWAGFDGEFGTDDDVDFGEQASNASGVYRFTDLPPGPYRVGADLTTAGLGMEATTDLVFVLTLEAGSADLAADFGFVSPDDLPNTGYDVERMLLLAGWLVAVGGALLAGAAVQDRKRRRMRPAHQRLLRPLL